MGAIFERKSSTINVWDLHVSYVKVLRMHVLPEIYVSVAQKRIDSYVRIRTYASICIYDCTERKRLMHFCVHIAMTYLYYSEVDCKVGSNSASVNLNCM